MRKKLVLSILLLSSLFLACNRDSSFERSHDLFKYLAQEQQLDMSKKNKAQLVILQVGNCGACTRDVLSFLEKKIPTFPDTTFVLLANDNEDIIATLSQIDKVKILTNSNNMLSKYGLRYVNDFIFLFEQGEIKKWFRLDEYGLKNAIKEL